MGIFADEICPWHKLICDGLDAGYFPTVRIWLGQTLQILQILQTPLHLIEASTKLVKGAEYGHGQDSRRPSTRASRTINCRCAHPTVTNRLHGEREKDPEVLSSAVRRQIYSRNMLYHGDQVRKWEADGG
jgi:hypothetical protein